MRRRTFITASLGLGMTAGAMPGLLAAQSRPITSKEDAGLRPYHGAALAFGTTVSVQVLHDDAEAAQQAIREALRRVKKVDALMTLYRPDSQIARLNRDGTLDNPDPYVRAVLNAAQDLSQKTHGAFDVTVQPLWALHAAAAKTGTVPDAHEVKAASRLADWRQVRIDSQRICLARAGMSVTLNGIAQGYASDLAMAALREHGIRHALLDAGEYCASGRPAHGRPWRLGIRDPRDASAMAAVLALEGRSMATSGDYETFFSPDFSRHHIIDPATGNSPPQLASVSVIAPTAMLADGLSTACMVMGAHNAIALCREWKDVDALLIAKSGAVWKTDGLRAMEI